MNNTQNTDLERSVGRGCGWLSVHALEIHIGGGFGGLAFEGIVGGDFGRGVLELAGGWGEDGVDGGGRGVLTQY